MLISEKIIYPPCVAVLFDCYDTLVSTKSFLDDEEILNKVFLQLGLPLTTLNSLQYKDRKSYLISLFGNKFRGANLLYENELEKSFLGKFTLNPGAEELLKLLKDNNIYSAIVSNKNGESLRMEVDSIKISHYFEKIIGSGDTDENKPSSKPLSAALEGSFNKTQRTKFFYG